MQEKAGRIIAASCLKNIIFDNCRFKVFVHYNVKKAETVKSCLFVTKYVQIITWLRTGTLWLYYKCLRDSVPLTETAADSENPDNALFPDKSQNALHK